MITAKGETNMGLYVNPRIGNNATWLEKHGRLVHPTRALVEYQTFRNSGLVPLVWVESNVANGAIGVAYSVEECRRFLANPLDERAKKVYVVQVSALKRDAGITPEELKDVGLS